MSDFSKSLLKIIVAQITKDSGFDGISSSACSVLIDVAERYLQLLAQLTLQNANHRDSLEVCLFDAMLALEELMVPTKALCTYWDKWGVRIPTNKLQAHKERGAATAGSGNAIIESILGIRKPIMEEEKMALPKEISGFFRMEPGHFPLDVDQFLGSDYSPETIQKVPDEDEIVVVERKEEEIEEESTQKKLFLYPNPFSESVYYQGTISEYIGHEFTKIESNKSKGKVASKTRKLFSRAYRSCLDSDSDTFHVDPSLSLMTLQTLQKFCLDRIRFSTVIPEASIAGFSLGLMEEVYTYYLPDLNGCKRALPQYKDDKKALRKELRALEAARLEPSTSDYPIRFHQDIINTYAAMTEDSKPDLKSEEPDMSKVEVQSSQIPYSQPATTPAHPVNSMNLAQNNSSVSIVASNSQPLNPTPVVKTQKTDKPVASPAKIKLKIKKDSSPLKITLSKPAGSSKSLLSGSKNDAIPESSVKKEVDAMDVSKTPTAQTKSPTLTSPNSVIKCICQHSTIDFGRFMIACDSCEVWFHGECVKVTPESIQSGAQWLCLRCCVD